MSLTKLTRMHVSEILYDSQGLIESSDSATKLKSKVKNLAANRDKLFKDWREMRTNCRYMRHSNRTPVLRAHHLHDMCSAGSRIVILKRKFSLRGI